MSKPCNTTRWSSKFDILGIIIPGLVLVIWYVVTQVGLVPAYLLPSPAQLGRVVLDFAVGTWELNPYSNTLWAHVVASSFRVLQGFSLAVIIGLPLGVLSGRLNVVHRLVDPSINLIRSVPGIGWLPLAMVWLGVGEKTTLFLIALAAFFPIFINAAQGSRNVSDTYLRAGEMLGANKLALFTTIVFPAALPSILAGLRLGLGLSWGYLVLGELTGVNQGLGAVMMDSRMLGHVDMVMVSMLYIAILGWLSDLLLRTIFKLVPVRVGG